MNSISSSQYIRLATAFLFSKKGQVYRNVGVALYKMGLRCDLLYADGEKGLREGFRIPFQIPDAISVKLDNFHYVKVNQPTLSPFSVLQ